MRNKNEKNHLEPISRFLNLVQYKGIEFQQTQYFSFIYDWNLILQSFDFSIGLVDPSKLIVRNI